MYQVYQMKLFQPMTEHGFDDLLGALVFAICQVHGIYLVADDAGGRWLVRNGDVDRVVPPFAGRRSDPSPLASKLERSRP